MPNTLAPLSAELMAEWYQGCTFTQDWASNYVFLWAKLLRPLRTAPLKILEIGSWEGRSALFFLNYLPNCQITCVDTFDGGQEHVTDPNILAMLPNLEKRFDANTNHFQSRMQKVRAQSHVALIDFGLARRHFDLVYVDGGHQARDVYGDAVLSWSLLNQKGFVIFDDYAWDLGSGPKIAIDAFCGNFINECLIVHRGYQLIVQKV